MTPHDVPHREDTPKQNHHNEKPLSNWRLPSTNSNSPSSFLGINGYSTATGLPGHRRLSRARAQGSKYIERKRKHNRRIFLRANLDQRFAGSAAEAPPVASGSLRPPCLISPPPCTRPRHESLSRAARARPQPDGRWRIICSARSTCFTSTIETSRPTPPCAGPEWPANEDSVFRERSATRRARLLPKRSGAWFAQAAKWRTGNC